MSVWRACSTALCTVTHPPTHNRILALHSTPLLFLFVVVVFTGGPCAVGTVWAAKGNATTLHQSVTAQCSRAGVCNTGRGDCSCLDGYGGLSCDRRTWLLVVVKRHPSTTSNVPLMHHNVVSWHAPCVRVVTGLCPSNCNTKGRCRTIGAVASEHASGTTSAGVGTTSHGVTYTNWEASKWYMCECDYGAYNADCSERT